MLPQIVFWTVLGSLPISALIIRIQIELFPIIVNANELRGTNTWGKTARVKWTQIIRVKRTHFFTLPYLKISTPQKKNAILLPLFLSDMNGFRAAVARFAAPENPLRVALEC